MQSQILWYLDRVLPLAEAHLKHCWPRDPSKTKHQHAAAQAYVDRARKLIATARAIGEPIEPPPDYP